MDERDFEGFEPSSDDPTFVLQSIVYFQKTMSLIVSDEYLNELVDEQSYKFTTKELQDLFLEIQHMADKKFAERKDRGDYAFFRH